MKPFLFFCFFFLAVSPVWLFPTAEDETVAAGSAEPNNDDDQVQVDTDEKTSSDVSKIGRFKKPYRSQHWKNGPKFDQLDHQEVKRSRSENRTRKGNWKKSPIQYEPRSNQTDHLNGVVDEMLLLYRQTLFNDIFNSFGNLRLSFVPANLTLRSWAYVAEKPATDENVRQKREIVDDDADDAEDDAVVAEVSEDSVDDKRDDLENEGKPSIVDEPTEKIQEENKEVHDDDDDDDDDESINEVSTTDVAADDRFYLTNVPWPIPQPDGSINYNLRLVVTEEDLINRNASKINAEERRAERKQQRQERRQERKQEIESDQEEVKNEEEEDENLQSGQERKRKNKDGRKWRHKHERKTGRNELQEEDGQESKNENQEEEKEELGHHHRRHHKHHRRFQHPQKYNAKVQGLEVMQRSGDVLVGTRENSTTLIREVRIQIGPIKIIVDQNSIDLPIPKARVTSPTLFVRLRLTADEDGKMVSAHFKPIKIRANDTLVTVNVAKQKGQELVQPTDEQLATTVTHLSTEMTRVWNSGYLLKRVKRQFKHIYVSTAIWNRSRKLKKDEAAKTKQDLVSSNEEHPTTSTPLVTNFEYNNKDLNIL